MSRIYDDNSQAIAEGLTVVDVNAGHGADVEGPEEIKLMIKSLSSPSC